MSQTDRAIEAIHSIDKHGIESFCADPTDPTLYDRYVNPMSENSFEVVTKEEMPSEEELREFYFDKLRKLHPEKDDFYIEYYLIADDWD